MSSKWDRIKRILHELFLKQQSQTDKMNQHQKRFFENIYVRIMSYSTYFLTDLDNARDRVEKLKSIWNAVMLKISKMNKC